MAKELRANIIINAQGEGFEELGNTIMTMGTMINQLSGPVIEFGKDSLNVYRDYEKAMTDAEIALSTKYGRGTRELSQVMGKLDEQATEWAATSIFHTNDVANAISNAAHAGWDYEQIIEGIPAAMYLAQAGSLDLSQAVDYIVKSTNSLGIEFDKTTDFVDLWTFAANSSATTIDEVGQAMLRMGGTMKFADNEAELLTMISVLANAGTTGEAAGTLLRNSMLRLIAPTKKASDVMASLGVDSAEAAEIMNDANVEAANAQLTMHGFSAYDENGELKPMLDTFTDLYAALVDINGGVEGLFDNEEVLGIVSAIFPTRTIAGAIALLNAAADGYGGLYDAMMGGEAEDYGEWAAKLENDTLYGSQEMFLSKLERLKQVTGEELSGQMRDLYTWLGAIIDTIAEMDPDNFSALVRAFEVLAIAGPGMMIAGAALKTIANPVGAIALAAVGFGMAVSYMQRLEELDLQSKFGDLTLDTQPITAYISTIGSAYSEEIAQIEALNQEYEKSFETFKTDSSEFLSGLYTAILSHEELDEADLSYYTDLGGKMVESVKQGIDANYSSIMASLSGAFGPDAANDADYNMLNNLIIQSYQNDIATAEGLSQQLRDALTSAFEDGKLTPDEMEKILAPINQMGDLIAMQSNAETVAQRQSVLRKASTLSLDELWKLGDIAGEQRDAELEVLMQAHDKAIGGASAAFDMAIQNGWWYDPETGEFSERYMTGYERVDGTLKNRVISETRDRFTQEEGDYAGAYNQYLWEEAIPLWFQGAGSEYAGQWETLNKIADQALLTGGFITPEMAQELATAVGSDGGMDKFMSQVVEMLGGTEQIEAYRDYFSGKEGYEDLAAMYGRVLMMDSLFGYGPHDMHGRRPINGAFKYGADESLDLNYYGEAGTESTILAGLAAVGSSYTDLESVYSDIMNNTGSALFGDNFGVLLTNAINAGFTDVSSDYSEQTQAIQKMLEYEIYGAPQEHEIPEDTYDEMSFGEVANSLITDVGALLLQGAATYQDITTKPFAEMMSGSEMPSFGSFLAETFPSYSERFYNYQPDWTPAMQAEAQPEEMQVKVTADDTELEAGIQEHDGDQITVNADADTSEMDAEINSFNGTRIDTYATVDTSAVQSSLDSYQGYTITAVVTVSPGGGAGGWKEQAYAEGGRADTASIFGEAGPEWAIPEQHTERTAELLNAAREASGFTWPELINRFGGLNSDPNHTPTTLVYSPTINAVDANGVASVLAADKTRLEQWWEDKQTRDAVEVYA